MTSTKEALWLAELKKAARNRPRESSKYLLFAPRKEGFSVVISNTHRCICERHKHSITGYIMVVNFSLVGLVCCIQIRIRTRA